LLGGSAAGQEAGGNAYVTSSEGTPFISCWIKKGNVVIIFCFRPVISLVQ
jgi:hypothetical protein